jgi:hypothetical protein
LVSYTKGSTLSTLRSTPNIIREDEIGGECSRHRTDEKCIYISLVGRSEWKKPFRRPRHMWEDNIRTDLKEIGWEDTVRIGTIGMLL